MRRIPVYVMVIVVVGLALVSTALVMAEETSPTHSIIAQDGMPGADGAALLDYVLNQNPYTEWGSWTPDRWNDYGGYLESGAPHGNTVRIFVNDVALDAAAADDFDGTLPAGSIVVKENFGGTVDEPGDVAALTIMYKVEGFNPEAGDWFWVKAAGDGSAIDAEGAVEGCIGCHSQDGNADYLLRSAFGEEPASIFGEPLPEADGQAVVDYILNTNPYTEWGSWPTDDVNTDDYSMVLASESVHGTSVRIFVNDRAQDAINSDHFHGTLPPGSMVVKESYEGAPDAPGDVVGLTVMYKVDGFNPDANDWYWVKAASDGSAVDAAGAVEGCIGCHSQEGNSDYLLRFDLSPYAKDMMMGDGDMMMEDQLDGNELVETRCTTCHTRDRIDNATKDRAGWEATVDRMIGYGAALNDAEREAMLEFLSGQ